MNLLRRFFFGGVDGLPLHANIGLFILRVSAGLGMAYLHGFGKIPPSVKFVQGVAEMGFPYPDLFGWAAALSEFAGGILLALGLCTRPASFLIFCTMAVAAFIRHAQDPLERRELALLYLAVALLFMLIGSGRIGMDALLRRS